MAHVADGLSRAWEGDEAGAIAAFDAALALAPRSSIAYLNRGLALRRQGDLDRAIADLNSAVKYLPAAPGPITIAAACCANVATGSAPTLTRAVQLGDRYADIDR